MNQGFTISAHLITSQVQARKSQIVWLLLFAGAISAALLLALVSLHYGPSISLVGWLIYLAGIAVIFYRPRWGIYLTLFFALLGDSILVPWYPFVKNFSSVESIFYLNNSFIFSPLETYLVLIGVSWLGRAAYRRKFHFAKGDLNLPTAIFLVFVVIGFVRGLTSGGNLNIALWEIRPFFYLFLMIFYGSNLLTRREHFNHILMWAAAGLSIEGIIGFIHIFSIAGGHLTSSEGITEHSAAIHMNTVFVLVLLAWLFKGSYVKRFAFLPVLPFMLLTYLAAQRRAAFVSIAFALALVAVLLFFENRKLFWLLIPPVVVAGLLYLAVFWNSTSSVAMPAQAIKSVIAPTSATMRDQASNGYRIAENIDTGFTVHQHPILGVGFGNKFYLPIVLPDISFFIWWNYLPHNSIIYVWLKAGLGGFLAMLYFIALSVVTGLRAYQRTQNLETKIVLLTGILYIIMHFLYAYVDISWDAQSMLYIGAVVAMINVAESVLAVPDPPAPKRHLWQSQVLPKKGL